MEPRTEHTDEVLAVSRSLARRAARVLGAGVAVELLSDDRAWLVRAAVDHADRERATPFATLLEHEPRSVRDPVFEAARAHGFVLVTRTGDERLPGVAVVHAESTSRAHPHPVLVCSLRTAEETVGLLLCVRDRDALKFNVHDVSLLVRLADGASGEIGRALASRAVAHTEARKLAELGTRMTTVTSALSDAARVDDVIGVLTELGAQAAFATGVMVCRAEHNGSALRVQSTRGLDGAFGHVGDMISTDSEHPLARVGRSGEPLWLSTGVSITRYFDGVSPVVAAGVGPLAILPLRIEERVLGVLVLRLPSASFDAQERGLLRILARHAAHALERAEMYESERRAVRRLEHLAAVSSALAVSTDLTSTLRTIAAAFVPGVADGVTITLSAELDHRVHEAGLEVVGRGRTITLTAHGDTLGELRLFNVHATLDDATDDLFVDELVRRASLALHAARTFRDLRAAIDAREEFLSVAGHELRTPLTTLRMCLFGMRASSPNESRVAERQIARLEMVVDQLLDVSKMSAGRLTLEPEDVDLVAVVRDVASQLENLQRASGSNISIEPRAQPTGLWDRFRITQVVSNLLANALKYGAGQPIEVTVDDDGSAAQLSVRDHGIGIAADAQPRIFDRFERAVTSREYAGFGVGLWICRQIVEAHDGSIRVESRPGAGAEFIVRLPKRLHSEVA